MPQLDFLRVFIYRTILKPPGEREEGDPAFDQVTLRHTTVDALFRWLGWFTHFYGATLTVLFFLRAGSEHPILVKTLEAFSEPYLGALGMYVILKEIRKRHHKGPSRHYGELFVSLWFVLLLVSTMMVIILPSYQFDLVYKLIVMNGLATLVIYIGGLIHRP